MPLSPQVLLSSLAKERCIAKLKELPTLFTNLKAKQSAGVLVPVCVDNGKVCLLYTLRSTNLKNHSGQVSFPGGKMDENETIIETALRETEEEIGIAKASVDVWGEMPKLQNRNQVVITPVVGHITDFDVNKLKPNLDEVQEVFTVSMDVLCDPSNHAHIVYKMKNVIPVFLNGKHTIWGLTGIMTHMFLQCFLPENEYKVDFMRKKYEFADLMPPK